MFKRVPTSVYEIPRVRSFSKIKLFTIYARAGRCTPVSISSSPAVWPARPPSPSPRITSHRNKYPNPVRGEHARAQWARVAF